MSDGVRLSALTEAERDRRWAEVRALLHRLNLDCLVTPPVRGQGQADSLYVSGVGGDAGRLACLVPLAGEPRALVKTAIPEPLPSDWLADVQPAAADFGSALAAALRETSLPSKRVGVSGLRGVPGAPDGIVSASIMRAIESALPGVEWVDVTDELRTLRTVKSAEEVALLRSGAELVDRAVERLEGRVRPGATDLESWAALVGALIRGGSAPPERSRWTSGLRPLTLDRPPHAELQRGSILVLEPEANVAGYRVRATQPLAVEACDAVFRDLCAVQAEYWQACFDLFVPGRPLGEIKAESAAIAKQLAARPGRYEKLQGGLALDGCGLGLDAPTGDAASLPDETVHAGWVFQLVAPVGLDVGPRVLTASWSDVVAVEESGPRRLGARPVGLAVTR